MAVGIGDVGEAGVPALITCGEADMPYALASAASCDFMHSLLTGALRPTRYNTCNANKLQCLAAQPARLNQEQRMKQSKKVVAKVAPKLTKATPKATPKPAALPKLALKWLVPARPGRSGTMSMDRATRYWGAATRSDAVARGARPEDLGHHVKKGWLTFN